MLSNAMQLTSPPSSFRAVHSTHVVPMLSEKACFHHQLHTSVTALSHRTAEVEVHNEETMSTAEIVHEDHQPSGAIVVHGCFLVGHTKMIAGDHLVDFMSQLTMFLEKVVGVSFACHHHSGGAIRKKRCMNNCRIAVVNGEALRLTKSSNDAGVTMSMVIDVVREERMNCNKKCQADQRLNCCVAKL